MLGSTSVPVLGEGCRSGLCRGLSQVRNQCLSLPSAVSPLTSVYSVWLEFDIHASLLLRC